MPFLHQTHLRTQNKQKKPQNKQKTPTHTHKKAENLLPELWFGAAALTDQCEVIHCPVMSAV